MSDVWVICALCGEYAQGNAWCYGIRNEVPSMWLPTAVTLTTCGDCYAIVERISTTIGLSFELLDDLMRVTRDGTDLEAWERDLRAKDARARLRPV